MRYGWMMMILISGVYIPGIAQQIPLSPFTVQDGLAHANVYSLYQAADQFLYIGTNRGLNSFDGKQFQHIPSENGLADCVVLCMTPCNKDSLLIGTYGDGLLMKTNQGISPYFPKLTETPAVISSIVYDGYNIWAIGKDSINKLYKIAEGKITQVTIASGNTDIATPFCVVKTGNEYLLGSSNGIYSLHKNGTVAPLWQQVFASPIKAIVKDESNIYWIGLQNELIGYKNTSVIKRFPFKGKSTLSDLLLRSTNDVWIATIADGVYVLKQDRQQPERVPMNIPPVVITDMLEDSEGGIWVSTQGKGIYRADNVYARYFPPEKALINVNCNALEPLDSQRILIGSVGTISIYNKGKLYPFKSRHIEAEDFIYFIKKTAAHILIGTSEMLIKKSIHPPYLEQVIKYEEKPVACISAYQDKKGTIWIGSFGRLFYLEDDKLHSVNDRLLNGSRINTLVEGGEQLFYLGTNEGVIVYNHNIKTAKPFRNSHPHLKIFSLKKDKKGRIWAATSSGLMYLQNETLQPFSLLEQIQNNDLYIDAHDRLWIATIKGVSCIDLATLKVTPLKIYAQAGEVEVLLFHQNLLFLGLLDGVSVIEHPKPKNTLPPKLHITSILINEKQVAHISDIKLSYGNNHLTVNFTGVSMAGQNDIIYRYKIPQLTDQWQTTLSNSILLTGLAPGSYNLLLSARRNNGAWSSNKRIRLTVDTPFWKTAWFLILTTIISVSGVYLFIRRIAITKERKAREKLLVQNKMAYLKQQALSALINPHFIFNCLNSVQYYLNKNQNNLANEYLADFAKLIRLTMEQSQETFITLQEETERLELYLSLEKLRLQEKLSWKLTVDPALDKLNVKIPNMILQPYVENAIWHGIMPKKTGGSITLSINKQSESELKIMIEDDGVGIDAKKIISASSHKKLGMSIIKERLSILQNLLQQSFTIHVVNLKELGRKSGTRIELILPISPENNLLETSKK